MFVVEFYLRMDRIVPIYRNLLSVNNNNKNTNEQLGGAGGGQGRGLQCMSVKRYG